MVGLNTWWADDPHEQYWLEITDRSDLGLDLFAPQVDDAGRPYWSYNLVTEVRDGDVVLHWHKSMYNKPALVGWSKATGTVEAATIRWQARGTVGRRLTGLQQEEPAWRIALADYTPLTDVVGQDDLRANEGALRRIHVELLAKYSGPLYFPYAFSDKRPVRTAQGYLVKFPAALLEVFSQLNDIHADELRPALVRPEAPPKRELDNADRYMSDPKVRRAVERHAVNSAARYYIELGYEVGDVGDFRSYDLHVTVAETGEERRVEVKGSTGFVGAVELTANEVANANGDEHTDLVVIDGIAWWRNSDGSIGTAGGSERVYLDWTPEPKDLTPTRYRYRLPN